MKPRLLFIGPLPEPTTGQSLACKVLLDALHDDYSVTVVDLRKETFRQGANSLTRIGEIVRAIARVRRAQADADLIYLTISESVAGNVKDLAFYAMCWRRLDRLVVHLHGGAGMRELLAGKVAGLAALNRFFLRRLAGVIVLGERMTGMYQSFVPAERIALVANFAPAALFLDDDDIRAQFAATGPLRVLFLSNLLPGKGYAELLEAVRRLDPEERERVHIDFAGGFEDEQSRHQFEAAIADQPQIRYHGVVGGDRKRDLLTRAHLFCLPTYYPYEGQPISILEAYAAGTAVLTTDHAGIFDVFTPGENGLAVAPRSPEAILDALRAALRDRAGLQRMALSNAATARAHYREHHYIDRMKAAFARLAPDATPTRQ